MRISFLFRFVSYSTSQFALQKSNPISLRRSRATSEQPGERRVALARVSVFLIYIYNIYIYNQAGSALMLGRSRFTAASRAGV